MGCAQSSSPLLFGTTTSLGVAVNTGSGTDISPGITVGYGREEVAIVPTIIPANVEPTETENRAILANVGGASNPRQDALSTFADFNNNNSGNANPVIDIGSTFATGIAAQYVALGSLCKQGGLTAQQCRDAVDQAARVATGEGVSDG